MDLMMDMVPDPDLVLPTEASNETADYLAYMSKVAGKGFGLDLSAPHMSDIVKTKGEDAVRSDFHSLERESKVNVEKSLMTTAVETGDSQTISDLMGAPVSQEVLPPLEKSFVDTVEAEKAVDSQSWAAFTEGLDESEWSLAEAKKTQDTRDFILLSEIAKSWDEVKDAGIISGIGDVFRLLTPINQADMANILPEVSEVFPGSRYKSYQDLLSNTPVEELPFVLKEAMDNLDKKGFFSSNKINKMVFLMSMYGMTENEMALENIGMIADVAGGLTTLKNMGKVISTYRAMKGGRASAAADLTLSLEEVTATGQVTEKALDDVDLITPAFLRPTSESPVGISQAVLKNREKQLKTVQNMEGLNRAKSYTETDMANAISRTSSDIEGASDDVVNIQTVWKQGEDYPTLEVSYGTGIDGSKSFVDEEAALAAADRMGLIPGEYSFKYVDNGELFIQRNVPVQIKSEDLVGMPDITPGLTGIKTLLASRDSVISKTFSEDIHLVSDARGAISSYTNSILAPINKLSGKDSEDFSALIYQSVQGEKWIPQSKLGAYSDKVRVAYDNYRIAMDLKHFALNDSAFQAASREGYRGITIFGDNAFIALDKANGKVLALEEFNPTNKLILDAETGKLFNPGELSVADIKKSKRTVIKLDSRAGVAYEGEDVTYILIDKGGFKVSPLSRNQVPYTPGGPRGYLGDVFIKQTYTSPRGIVGKPRTFAVGVSVKDSKKLTEDLNKVLEAARLKDVAGVTRLLQKSTVSKFFKIADYDDLMKLVDEGVLNLNHSFEAVRGGDIPSETLKAISDGKHVGDIEDIKEFMQFQDAVQLSGSSRTARGDWLKTIDGSLSPLASPAKMAEGALRQFSQIRVVSPLIKNYAANFKKEFGHIMVPSKGETEIESILNAKLMSGGASISEEKKFYAAREHFKTFISTPTWTERQLTNVGEQIADYLDLKTFSKMRNTLEKGSPFRAMRSIAFQTKLGMLAINQVAVQGSAIVLAASLHPKLAVGAAVRYPAYITALVLDDASVTSTFVKAGMDKEVFEALKKSGKWLVSGEMTVHADIRETIVRDRLMRGVEFVKKVGAAPFTEVERGMSVMGYDIAANLWRKAHPNKSLSKASQEDLKWISTEADFIVGNMRKSGDALWSHRGPISTPTQFASWHARMTEAILPAFLGGTTRFTGPEKARIAMGQFLAWGGMATVGGGYFMDTLNWVNNLYKEQYGTDMPKDVRRIAERGLVDEAFHQMGINSGMSVNSGLQYMDNLWFKAMRGDLTLPEFLGGASGKIAWSMGGDLRDIGAVLFSPVNPEDTYSKFDLTLNILDDKLAKHLSGYGRLSKFYEAQRLGRIRTARGDLINNITETQAYLQIFGVDPNQKWDVRTIEDLKRAKSQNETDTMNGLKPYYKDWLTSENGEEAVQAFELYKKMKDYYLGGRDPKDQARLIQNLHATSYKEFDLTEAQRTWALKNISDHIAAQDLLGDN